MEERGTVQRTAGEKEQEANKRNSIDRHTSLLRSQVPIDAVPVPTERSEWVWHEQPQRRPAGFSTRAEGARRERRSGVGVVVDGREDGDLKARDTQRSVKVPRAPWPASWRLPPDDASRQFDPAVARAKR